MSISNTNKSSQDTVQKHEILEAQAQESIQGSIQTQEQSIQKYKKGGVDRSHDPSLLPKIGFFILHLFSIFLCIYMILGNGLHSLNTWTNQSWVLIDLNRGTALLGVAGLYWIRHTITLFYLLVRKVEWKEILGLSVFILIFEIGLCVIGAGIMREEIIPFGMLDGFAVGLVILGSFLNTASEIQRKWWKQYTENKGRCYTKGLFKYSMHINYFGDTVLFLGWCLLTMNYWTLILPIGMAASFIFFHIPSLDAYLAERYGEEFIRYSYTTKKFIPFIY